MSRRELLIAAVIAIIGCGETEVSVGDYQEVVVLPAVPNRDLDILFVIDNSTSMYDEQESLAANFPRMMDALTELDGGLPNVHIGVVTTDLGQTATNGIGDHPDVGVGSCQGVGDDGALQHAAPELGSALYISDIANPDGTRNRNFTGELRDVFAKIATVGDVGCGIEQPLAAMRRALENPANGDFLRASANLAVIIITDEDDCSAASSDLFSRDKSVLGPQESFRCTQFGVACDDGGKTPQAMATVGPKGDCHARSDSSYVQDIAEYVDFLTTLKGDPYAVMVGVIAADADNVSVELRQARDSTNGLIPSLAHTCESEIGYADPAVRLNQFVRAFSQRGAFSSICNGDLGLPLESLGYVATKLYGNPCIDIPLADTSAESGVQARCNVMDGAVGAEAALPLCDATHTTDCWSLRADPTRCTHSAQNLRLEVTRAATPTKQRYAHLRCATANRAR